jgi:ribosomal protein S18 acetylase RimI-like enzyme
MSPNVPNYGTSNAPRHYLLESRCFRPRQLFPVLGKESSVHSPGTARAMWVVAGHDGRYAIRPYEPRDRNVVGLLRALAHDEDPDNGDWGKPPHPSVTHRTAVLTDATENARVVGAARVICDGARTAHLQFICVEEERRGLGLGGALLAWVEAIAAEAFGAREVELEVDRSNDHAQAVYRKRGYAHEEETSAANRAWSENPTIRRVLGPPRVQRFVKRLDRGPAASSRAPVASSSPA